MRLPKGGDRLAGPRCGRTPAVRHMSFAAALSQRVSAKRQETKEREAIGKKWLEVESKHIEAAVELFKQRCIRAAQNLQCTVTVSFEVLTRDVANFPTYTVKDGSYLVDAWGTCEPASWWYARRGSAEPFAENTPVQFAEVLEGMMPKFLEKVSGLGFVSCGREPGTWRVKVAWRTPEPRNGASASRGDVQAAAKPSSPSSATQVNGRAGSHASAPPAPPDSPPPPPTDDEAEEPTPEATSPVGDCQALPAGMASPLRQEAPAAEKEEPAKEEPPKGDDQGGPSPKRRKSKSPGGGSRSRSRTEVPSPTEGHSSADEGDKR